MTHVDCRTELHTATHYIFVSHLVLVLHGTLQKEFLPRTLLSRAVTIAHHSPDEKLNVHRISFGF